MLKSLTKKIDASILNYWPRRSR